MIVGKSRRRDVKKVSSWGPRWINATLEGNEPNLGVPQQQQQQQAWAGGWSGRLRGDGGKWKGELVLGGWSSGVGASTVWSRRAGMRRGSR